MLAENSWQSPEAGFDTSGLASDDYSSLAASVGSSAASIFESRLRLVAWISAIRGVFRTRDPDQGFWK